MENSSTAMQPRAVLVHTRERGTTSLMNPPTISHHRLPTAPSSRVIRWVEDNSRNSFTASRRPTDEMLRSGSVMKMSSYESISGNFSNRRHIDVPLSSPAVHAASARSHLARQGPKQILRKIASRMFSLATNEQTSDEHGNDGNNKPPLRSLRRHTATGVEQHQRCDDDKTSAQEVVTLKQHTILLRTEKRRMRKSTGMSNYADSRRHFEDSVKRQPTKVDAVDVGPWHNHRATGSIAIRPIHAMAGLQFCSEAVNH